jgi:NAD(P)-dependent dehydrogenase (short-subunit alcohol dehydrogenase family)
VTHPLFDLSGRVALVSGAASGMGRAMSIAFAEVGANLMLADINTEGMQDTAAHIERLGRRAIPVTCDVSSPEQIRAMFAQLDQEYGKVDILGNVAGEGHLGRPEEITIEQLQEVLQNLVVGRFCATREAGRRMLAAGKGSIISLGSIGGVTSLGRGHVVYGMAMAAVIQMTRELSTEWSGKGVRVNAILPAQVVNEGLEKRMQADPNLKDTFLRGIPIGRLGKPDDIKGLAIFLASDASDWITGAIVPMDGGNLAKNAGGSHIW